MSRAGDKEAFLARWARLKRRGADAPPGAEEQDAPEPAAAARDEPRELPEDLRDFDAGALDPQSTDFSRFVQSDVPRDIQRLALRRLWQSDETLANLDGLNDYDEDFTPQGIAAAAASFLQKGARMLDSDSTRGETMEETDGYLIAPDLEDARLTREVEVVNERGERSMRHTVQERPLTIFLNGQEVITAMTIGDHPDWLAVGYLRNQAMLRDDDEITGIDHDEDIHTIVVRTRRKTDYEEKMRRKVHTSGCAQGTVFGDVMEEFEKIRLPDAAMLRTSWLYALLKKIATTPSLYMKAGSIHGCALCQKGRPLVYIEDVGRHNAVDKIAGWMFLNKVEPGDKIFFTTGRLTSEMVLKCAAMGIPVIVSRSGFTAWGVELARKVNMTIIGRARGRRFICASGDERIIRDAPLSKAQEKRQGGSRSAHGKDVS